MDVYLYLEVCLKSIEDRKVLDDLLKYGQQDNLAAIQEYEIGGQNGLGMVTHTRGV